MLRAVPPAAPPGRSAAAGRDVAADLLRQLDASDAANILARCPSTTPPSVLRPLDEAERERALDALGPDQRRRRSGRCSAHAEDTAGAIMTPDVTNRNARRAARARSAARLAADPPEVEGLLNVVVVDRERRPLGVIPAMALVAAGAEIRSTCPPVRTDTPLDDVIELFATYDVLAVPVVDAAGRPRRRGGDRRPARRDARRAASRRAPLPGHRRQGGVRRRSGLVALAAVVGPGVLAGLSDDDPAGITTYSILGADYGYELLWVLLLSTVALMVFHELGMRMGVATGQGLTGLVRQRFGVKAAVVALATLVIANVGTTCAEFAGVAASLELAGVTRYVSVPIAAVGVSLLVMRGGFRRVEHVLLALATVFVTYIAAGLLAGPDWGATARGLVVPALPGDTAALVAATATVGTTLAPWGLAFIQSYAVDKRLTPDRLRYERVDVVRRSGDDRRDRRVRRRSPARRRSSPRAARSTPPRDAATALEPLAGGSGLAALRRRPARRGAARGVDPAALDRLLGQRDARLREPPSTTRSARRRCSTGATRDRGASARGSC